MTNDRLKDIAFFVSLIIFIACTENRPLTKLKLPTHQ